jgi:uncharacterized protein
MRLFFDSSAFIKRYILEPGSIAVESLCRESKDVALAIVCPVEVLSAINRIKREGRLSATEYEKIKDAFLGDIRDITLVAIDAQVVNYSIRAVESSPLKALDSLHIGCALLWKPDCFVSSDFQQVAGAKKMGLAVKHV